MTKTNRASDWRTVRFIAAVLIFVSVRSHHNTALGSGIEGDEIVDQLLSALRDKARSSVIDGAVEDFDNASLTELYKIVAACKNAWPPSPASLYPCVRKIFPGNDFRDHIKRIQSLRKAQWELVEIASTCDKALTLGVPEWRKRSDEVIEAFVKLADDVEHVADQEDGVRKLETAFAQRVEARGRKAKELQLRAAENSKSRAQLEASVKAESNAIAEANKTYNARKEEYRNKNADADFMIGLLRDNARSGRLSAEKAEGLINEFKKTGQFPVYIPEGHPHYKQSFRNTYNVINANERDLHGLRDSVGSRQIKIKGIHSQIAKLDDSAADLQQRQAKLADDHAEQEAIREELNNCRVLLDRKSAEVIQRTKELREKIDPLAGVGSIFDVCVWNLSQFSAATDALRLTDDTYFGAEDDLPIETDGVHNKTHAVSELKGREKRFQADVTTLHNKLQKASSFLKFIEQRMQQMRAARAKSVN